MQKVREQSGSEDGFNAQTETYENLVTAGVVDPTKVVRAALQNASSIASLLLTTEALVSEIPEEKKDVGMPAAAAAWAAWAACTRPSHRTGATAPFILENTETTKGTGTTWFSSLFVFCPGLGATRAFPRTLTQVKVSSIVTKTATGSPKRVPE